MSLPPEILKKVKLLELSVRKKVDNVFTGEYHSAFKGQGMTFSEFREYVPGDDVRDIAWSLTARTGKPFIKKYDEERETTLFLVVDVSGSVDFGSKQYLKGEVIIHLAALLAFAAKSNNDPIGLLMFSDQIEHFVPPKKGIGQVHRILRDLFYIRPRSKKTGIGVACDHILKAIKKKAHVFIFSDFADHNFESSIRLLGKKHDTVAVVVDDSVEKEFPDVGLLEWQDPETGERICMDTSSAWFRQTYTNGFLQTKDKIQKTLRSAGIDHINISVGDDYVTPFISFFKKRGRK